MPQRGGLRRTTARTTRVSNWMPSPEVIISPEWIDEVLWNERKVVVSLPKQRILEAPRFDASAPVNRAYEERLYDFYGRPRYW